MLKYPLFALINCLLITVIMAKGRDTTKFYFKDAVNGHNAMASGSDYDYYRVLLPPDSGEVLYNVKEFYRNGALKFAGKCENTNINLNGSVRMFLMGDAIGFYPSGKRQYIAHFSHGVKRGAFYQYYPDGKLYSIIKSAAQNYNDSLWQCYDRNGVLICKNGNGKWINYDVDFKHITDQGTVKNCLRDGSWTGTHVIQGDSVKYEEIYAIGLYKSGKSFDRKGKSIPYYYYETQPNFRGTGLNFMDMFRNRIQWPRDSTGKKMKVILDSLHISFIVEKDGSVSDFKIPDKVDSSIVNALHQAFLKCPKGWEPHKTYGWPIRVRLIVDVKRKQGFVGEDYERREAYKEEILEK